MSLNYSNGLLCGLLCLTASCAKIGGHAERKADRSAYNNIRAYQHVALGNGEDFTIDEDAANEMQERLLAAASPEQAELLSLSDTLAIAMANSRSYQRRKESLFIEALNLSETQKDFGVSFDELGADVSTSYRTFDDGTSEIFGERGADIRVGAGIRKVLASGATLSLDLTENALRYFSNPAANTENNALTFNVVQPLLSRFGPLVTKEPLRQAERDMIYEVRAFKRFQLDFVIDIAAQYYAALRSRDAELNARLNYESAMANRKQTESYAKAGRIAEFQAAQARQSELNAADRWVLAQSSYRDALDDLRFTLGIPIDLNVEPDPAALSELTERGLVEVGIGLDGAIDQAVSNRLDLVTRRERVEDRTRALAIQERRFLPDLDVGYRVRKNFNDSGNGEEVSQSLTVGLDLPFDWLERRNAYRIAQINLEREIRGLEEDEDRVRRSVRNLWRRLRRNRSVYQNRLLSVELSERRVESTTLLLKQGKALTRDLLEAEEDLLSSRNSATQALVEYTINRLRFWEAIERFVIDSKGMWYEQVDGHIEEPVATP